MDMTQGTQDAFTPELAGTLEAAARGDADAWRRLVHLYSGRIFALAKSRCRDPEVAEEITQSVFATVAAKLGAGGYSEQGRFESWLFRIAMNRVRDLIRKNKRRTEFSGEERIEAAAECRQTGGADLQELDRLRAALEQLSEADREVVELRHHGDMSFKQIADVLDEPLGTLLARHHRALRKLREIMEAPQPDTARAVIAANGRETHA